MKGGDAELKSAFWCDADAEKVGNWRGQKSGVKLCALLNVTPH